MVFNSPLGRYRYPLWVRAARAATEEESEGGRRAPTTVVAALRAGLGTSLNAGADTVLAEDGNLNTFYNGIATKLRTNVLDWVLIRYT